MLVNGLRKSCRLRDNVEKYWKAEKPVSDNVAHTCCMLGD
jgi:hypothetical protein